MPKKLQRKLSVSKVGPATAVANTGSPSGRGFSIGGNRVTHKILAQFTNQLAVLLNAGIPIAKSLRVIEGQLPAGPMKRIAAGLVEDVEYGAQLATHGVRVFYVHEAEVLGEMAAREV